MFEQVGEAGAVFRLQAHADVVHHRHADRGRGEVCGDDDGQAVVELLHGDRQGPLVGGGVLDRQGAGDGQKDGGDGAFAHDVLKKSEATMVRHSSQAARPDDDPASNTPLGAYGVPWNIR